MTHRRVLVVAATLASLSSAAVVLADDAPAPPPPQHEWIGKGQAGYLSSKGNTDSKSINASLDVSRTDYDWKNALYLGGLYGRSANILSAERWEVREQTDYNINPKLFAFGGLRFEHDMFDGFQYQGSVTSGIGYKFLDFEQDKLTAQVGAGFRKLRPETITMNEFGSVISRVPLDESSEAIATVSIDYFHKFTKTTTLTNKFILEYGSDNTMTHDEVALAVQMSTKLALSIGYAFTDNSQPAPPLKKVDTLTTVNLVYSF